MRTCPLTAITKFRFHQVGHLPKFHTGNNGDLDLEEGLALEDSQGHETGTRPFAT